MSGFYNNSFILYSYNTCMSDNISKRRSLQISVDYKSRIDVWSPPTVFELVERSDKIL